MSPRRSPRHGLRAAPVLALAAGALLLSATQAHAYCRSASCPEKNEPGRICEPASTDDCGTPLLWARPCVGFNVQRDASEQASLPQAEAIFTKAFEAWMNAACSGGHPGIRASYTGSVACATVEYNTDKANANVVMFRDASWPHSGTGVLAMTTVTFSRSTGEIYDADIEVNTALHDFAVADTAPGADLLSVATHEAGHFLGLSHSADPEATMFAVYTPGTISQRTLEADDVAGICDAYPAGASPGECDTVPRHGFSSLCGADQTEGAGGPEGGGAPGDDGGSGGGAPGAEGGAGGAAQVPRACSAAPPSGGPRALPAAALLALGLLAARRRRRAPRPPR